MKHTVSMKMPGKGQRIFWEENAVLVSSLIILPNNTAVLSGLGWRAVKLFFFLKKAVTEKSLLGI